MFKYVEERLARILAAGHERVFHGALVGLEKESLRVNAQGSIAQTDHPRGLGSPLTNPYITTDYSEALLELITPPVAELEQALATLCAEHQFVYANLADELLWATSMPCVIRGETSIPIARYGSSNAGMMKHVYRRGLGHRYGRVMQVIAGVHFNYSFPQALWPLLYALDGAEGPLGDYVAGRYFALIRNLQRVGWLIPFLFGASPAVCKSFLGGVSSRLESFDGGTFFEPYATSLRMGDIGYQNNKENEHGIKACYDSLDAYVASLSHAISTPCADYAAIGVKVDGEYRQLSANILQIENEYYSTVRPKQPLNGLEKPVRALASRGVQYVELRSLDVNAFEPLGVSESQLRFIEALMVLCLLADSPPIDAREQRAIDANEMAAAHRGREPGLRLQRDGGEVALTAWAAEICDRLEPVCAALDQGRSARPYAESLAQQRAAIADPDLTPSARMLAQMRANGESFFDFAQRLSERHETYFLSQPCPPDQVETLRRAAALSLQEQAAIEAADEVGFDEFLARYMAQ